MFSINLCAALTYCNPFSSGKQFDQKKDQASQRRFEELCRIGSLETWKKNFSKHCHLMNAGEFEHFIGADLSRLVLGLNINLLKKETSITNVPRYVEEHELLIDLDSGKSPPKPGLIAKISRFFSNIIENLIDALNIFDGKNPPTNIYEKNAGIQIYFQFLKIPFALAVILQPFLIIPWKVYSIVLVLLASSTLGIYTYMNWFRSFPKTVPFCDSIEESIVKEYPYPIHGFDKEMKSLIKRLNRPLGKPRSVMLFTDSGQGKTTIIYKLHQMIKSGHPLILANLKNKKIFLMKGREVAKSMMGTLDKIKNIESKLAGFEKDAIIFIDELHAFAENPDAFELMKDFLRHPSIQFVTAITPIKFRKIKKMDTDYSFRRTFSYIPVDKFDPEQLGVILKEMIDQAAKELIFNDTTIAKIIELSNNHLPNVSQPTKALKLLEYTIDAYRTKFDYSESKGKSGELPQVTFLKSVNKMRNDLKVKCVKDSILLMKSKGTSSGNLELQKKYLFHKFYVLPALNEMINALTENLSGETEVVVTPDFVEEVFLEYKTIEEKVFDDEI